MKKVIALITAGRKSIVLLHELLKVYRKDEIYAIGFNYNQKNSVELEKAVELCYLLDIEYKAIDIREIADVFDTNRTTGYRSFFDKETSYTGTDAEIKELEKINDKHYKYKEYPSWFIPNLNMYFLTMSNNIAQKMNIDKIYIGTNLENIFPDQKRFFYNYLEEIFEKIGNKKVEIISPFKDLTDVEVLQKAYDLNIFTKVIKNSVTCLNANKTAYSKKAIHDWGLGCGVCDKCITRKTSYYKYMNLK